MNNKKKQKRTEFEIVEAVNRKLYRTIVKTAVKNGISIKDIEENHKDFVEKTRKKLLKEEIESENKERDKEPMEDFGFSTEEKDFMVKEYMYNQVGYRAIAKALGKDEIMVRKQIAQLMSELVA